MNEEEFQVFRMLLLFKAAGALKEEYKNMTTKALEELAKKMYSGEVSPAKSETV